MTKTYLSEIQYKWANLPAKISTRIEGTNPHQLDLIEILLPLGMNLPAAVKEYLAWAGDFAGTMYMHVNFSAGSIRFYQEAGRDDVRDNLPNGELLPDDILVLNEYLGDNFYFLKLSEGENPPVYFWQGGTLADARQQSETFTEWVVNQINNYERYGLRC